MLSLRPRRPLAGWLSTFLLTLGMASFSYFAVPWAYLGMWLRYALAALFVVAVIVSLLRTVDEERPPESPVRMMVKVLIGFFFANVAMGVMRARAVPPGAVDLPFPLSRGRYVVVHGGSTPAANTYVGRGVEGFGVDVMAKVGEAVTPPCAGTVLAAKPFRVRCGDVIVEMRGVNAWRVAEKQVHIHAERNGQPVPITFGGRWLVRNDVMKRP